MGQRASSNDTGTTPKAVAAVRSALAKQRSAIHHTGTVNDREGLLAAALHELEAADLGASSVALGVLVELASARLEQGRTDEAAELQERVVRGCEAGTAVGGHAKVQGRSLGEDLAWAQLALARTRRSQGCLADAATLAERSADGFRAAPCGPNAHAEALALELGRIASDRTAGERVGLR